MADSPSWRVEFYQDERGRQPVTKWLLTLEAKGRARVRWTIRLLETYGTQLTTPYARHLRGKLWELRIPSGLSWGGDSSCCTLSASRRPRRLRANYR